MIALYSEHRLDTSEENNQIFTTATYRISAKGNGPTEGNLYYCGPKKMELWKQPRNQMHCAGGRIMLQRQQQRQNALRISQLCIWPW